MACAGLLTVCLIRPPAPEPPRPPAPAPAAGPAGHALFQDVSGERAGDAGAVALGVVSLAVSLQVSVVSLPVSPCTLSLSACPRLCGSLTLLFPVSMSVSLPPGLLGTLPLPLGLCLSHYLSLTLLSLFPCVSLIFISQPLCPILSLILSLLISPCLWFSVTVPPAPQPRTTPCMCLAGGGGRAVDP